MGSNKEVGRFSVVRREATQDELSVDQCYFTVALLF